ncbi:gliding motility protein [Pedobacter yulinensis]|uniref:Gliding motility protein n=1 Tax=Pedobacter yulinensis TaxID=2126353 RepID=A0A2T3HNR8_9SPHI|nr:tetratricopeptide repeat protein [Pedobacter yulinensis]PST84098.1 gliding motility protein [Pedobacter yulinensis]
MNKAPVILLIALACCTASLFWGCSTQNGSAYSRGLQNLTARYNYIYNSKTLLDEYSNTQLAVQPENYDEILPVYPGPPPRQIDAVALPGERTKALDELIAKAKAIITDKSYSNYIDDAYLLLGKAYYYKSDYFISFEYFDYAAKTYRRQVPVFVEANTWAARTQLQLGRTVQAARLLDSIKKYLPLLKKKKAAALATLAQFEIQGKNYGKALDYLRLAMKQQPSKQERIRWNYIAAQLSEQLKNPAQAYRYYTLVKKSNAPFELYFNADLNRLRISLAGSSSLQEKERRLLSLLRDDKNLDYSDQVYYRIAELFREAGQQQAAERYYRRSAALSIQNNYQKGLSYLRIADLNFEQANDYVQAKLYYDSAVASLPPTYPEYSTISKKALNLEYLSSRYQVISRQDTLQMLAALPDGARRSRILTLVKTQQQSSEQPVAQGGSAQLNPDQGFPASMVATGSNFYFNNPAAMTRGRTDFVRRFGNRPLTDNWRQQVRSSVQSATAAIDQGLAPAQQGPGAAASPVSQEEQQIRAYTDSLPLNAERLLASNKKIADALFQLGSFYQQVLNDTTQAIRSYERLLDRYPQNAYLPIVYYSLYLAYKDRDPQQADRYREKLLRGYPSTLYARMLTDPQFFAESTKKEKEVNQHYDGVFTQYEKGDYEAVIAAVQDAAGRFPDNFLSPQYAYLRAIAIGKTQHVDSLVNAFSSLVLRFPDDKVITPLVKEHLAYIQAHLPEFSRRAIALTDFDPNEPHFLARTEPRQPAVSRAPGLPPPALASAPVKPAGGRPATPKPDSTSGRPSVARPPADTTAKPAPPALANRPVAQPPPAPDPATTFSKAASNTYYVVIRVADPSLVLSSSRFGIGQFNRGNYAAAGLRHQLTQLPADQLIYIGNFSSFADAKAYSAAMVPLLRSIMKVPADRYEPFIISRENFELLKNTDLIEDYLNFYKNNY